MSPWIPGKPQPALATGWSWRWRGDSVRGRTESSAEVGVALNAAAVIVNVVSVALAWSPCMTKVVVVVVDVMSETLFDLAAKDTFDRPALLGIDGYAHWGLYVSASVLVVAIAIVVVPV